MKRENSVQIQMARCALRLQNRQRNIALHLGQRTWGAVWWHERLLLGSYASGRGREGQGRAICALVEEGGTEV